MVASMRLEEKEEEEEEERKGIEGDIMQEMGDLLNALDGPLC